MSHHPEYLSNFFSKIKKDHFYLLLALASGIISLRWKLNSISKLDTWLIGSILFILSFIIFKSTWSHFFYGFKRISLSSRILIFLFLLLTTLSFKEVFWRFYIDKFKCLQYAGASIGNLFLGIVFIISIVSIKDFPVSGQIFSWISKVTAMILNMKRRQFLFTAFLFTFILTNLISYFVLEHIPHIQDSISYLFHAKIFQLGHLYIDSHPQKQFFDFLFMINDGKWYSQYQWGHPFLLLLGLLINMPWIVNPLMGSLTVIIIFYIANELYSEPIARYSVILASLSPFLIFMSSGFMSHTGTMLFLAIFSFAILRTFKRDNLIYPIIAGLTLGFACNIRILTSFATGLPFIFFAFYRIFKTGFFRNIKKITAFSIAFLPLVCSIFFYNYVTTGKPFLFGYIVFNGEYHNYGFGESGMAWYKIKGEVFHKMKSSNPLTGFFNRNEDLTELNNYLFELPIPSLIFILILFLSKYKNRWDFLLISPMLSLTFFYYFYFFQSITYGPRFLFESFPGLVILSARGITIIPDFIKDLYPNSFSMERIKTKAVLLTLTSFFLLILVGYPYLVRFYSFDYWEVSTTIQKVIKENHIDNALIFIKFEYEDDDEEVHNISGSYHFGPWNSAFLLNTPQLDTDIIFARDMGDDNYLLKQCFPEKSSYLYHPLDGELTSL